MPLQCCAIDSGGRRHRSLGFSLLELVVVLALVGMLAGVVGVAAARSTPAVRERDSLRAMAAVLAQARVEAMRRGVPVCASIEVDERDLGIMGPGTLRRVSRHGLIAIDEAANHLERLDACFDASGRTDQRVWRFISAAVNRTELLNAGVLGAPWEEAGRKGEVRGRVWRIVFDPISGAPRVGRADRQEGDTS